MRFEVGNHIFGRVQKSCWVNFLYCQEIAHETFVKASEAQSLGFVLIGIIEIIVDDNEGKLNICCLTETNKTTFEMMGLLANII